MISASRQQLVRAREDREGARHRVEREERLQRVEVDLAAGQRIELGREGELSGVNIGAAILGWQIFSLTNVSTKRFGIGNPFALHRGERGELVSWTHKTIFNFRGLKELCEAYGLVDVRVLGAGYFPLPARLGRVDPRHAHFITVSAAKVSEGSR